MLRFFVLTLACVTHQGSGAALRRSANSKAATAADGAPFPEKTLVSMLTSLNELAVSLAKEQETFKSESAARAKACADVDAGLQKSIKEQGSTAESAQNELEKATGEVDSIQGAMDTIQGQVKEIEGELASLQQQLVDLRANRAAAVKRDAGYAQQVKAILKRAEQRIDSAWTQSAAQSSGQSSGDDDAQQDETSLLLNSASSSAAAESDATELQKLEEGLRIPSFMQLDLDSSEFSVASEGKRGLFGELQDESDAPNSTAKAGNSTDSEAAAGKKALQSDAEDINEAARKSGEAFEMEELRLMDLIRAKRKELRPLDLTLANRQPELADQLRKISEANRSAGMARSNVAGAKQVQSTSEAKCQLLKKAKDFESAEGPTARAQLMTGIGFLKGIAAQLGYVLPPGAQGGKVVAAAPASAPSFMQLGSSSEGSSSADLSEAVRSAISNMEAIGDSDFQASTASNSIGAFSSSGLQGKTLAKGQEASTSGDPLAEVKSTISNLIESLRDEKNQDMEKKKFCTEQAIKTGERAKKMQNQLEAAEQAKRWADNAVSSLQAEIKSMESGIARLQLAKQIGKQNLDAERARISAEAEHHESASNILGRSRELLQKECSLPKNAENVTSGSGNCAQADAALRRTGESLKKLDEYLATYIVEFANLTETQKADAETGLSLQQANHFQARADLNRRQDELAQIASDILTAQNHVQLAKKAAQALKENCGPKVYKMEDLVERRKEEISQMRNAIKVLDGEAFA
eukprot:TRINITY_DN2536_c0_g1_i1.p1 TRINITY_DN2536_c0_g1~~TRINITY_DN2536_c0_g1_i1.p1  ORF type:complete len:753 (+),score=229.62 TRINITY_DN2536_c0_g1_i1:96-2354(+)